MARLVDGSQKLTYRMKAAVCCLHYAGYSLQICYLLGDADATRQPDAGRVRMCAHGHGRVVSLPPYNFTVSPLNGRVTDPSTMSRT
jgi:hypothetical protein